MTEAVLFAGGGGRRLPRPLASVRGHLDAGRPLLAIHAAASLLPGRPEWEELLGGRWVDGISWHPEHDERSRDSAGRRGRREVRWLLATHSTPSDPR